MHPTCGNPLKQNKNLGKEVGIWVQLSIESSVEEPCCDRFGEGLASCQLNDFMHSWVLGRHPWPVLVGHWLWTQGGSRMKGDVSPTMRGPGRLHHGPWKMAFFQWSDLMVQHPWSNFLRNQFTKPLGSSLGVNQMWIKRSEMTMRQQVNVLIFVICVWKGWKPFYCLLLSLSSLPPQKDFNKHLL